MTLAWVKCAEKLKTNLYVYIYTHNIYIYIITIWKIGIVMYYTYIYAQQHISTMYILENTGSIYMIFTFHWLIFKKVLNHLHLFFMENKYNKVSFISTGVKC